MVEIVLDGLEITGKEQLYRIFREGLELPDYFGDNLDALYDVLSTYSEKVQITIRNEEELCSGIPYYGKRIIDMLNVAAEENEPYIIIKKDDNMEEELW